MTETSQTSRKPATRRALLARRDAVGEAERARRGAKIAERAVALLRERVASGSTIGLYAAKGSEVDTTAIDDGARAAGLVVAYPRVIGDARALAFHTARIEDLVPARFGLREPSADTPAVELAGVAAFVMPGLAFDRAGGRVGWGRGHYDATVTAAPHALRIGVAFELQIVESVPCEAHDAPLHVIITEAATYAVE